jgi:hypothetical protein
MADDINVNANVNSTSSTTVSQPGAGWAILGRIIRDPFGLRTWFGSLITGCGWAQSWQNMQAYQNTTEAMLWNIGTGNGYK